MSKIIKAEKLCAHDFIQPKIDLREEETFLPLLSFAEEGFLIEGSGADVSTNKTKQVEGSQEKSEKIKREKTFEEQLKLAQEEGFKRGYEEGFQRAKEEGFKRGLEEGLKEAEKRLEEEKERLHKKSEEERQKERERFFQFIETLDKEFKTTILNLDEEILKLALKVAQKLLFKTLEVDKEPLLRIIREALKYLAEGSEVRVKVNPREFEFLKEKMTELPKGYKITFIPDETVSEGGVFIESKMGVIDATFEKRWQKLLEALSNEDTITQENTSQT